MKLKIKTNVKKLVALAVIIISFIILFISLYNIVMWKVYSVKTNKNISEIQKAVDVEEVIDSDNTKIISDEEIDASNPYWDYIRMNLINVDFNNLISINNDTKGWIQVNGTNINYPFVQANDNSFYLTHSFDKSYNQAGWVFLDYRNDINNLSKNTIIYAHGRLDKTMFGSLKNILSNGWMDNSYNYVVKLSTENENTLWQVFSVYHIPTTSDYIQVNFDNDEEYISFIKMIINRGAYNFNVNINRTDYILTLSTCFNDTEKVVLHAKLIKKEEK